MLTIKISTATTKPKKKEWFIMALPSLSVGRTSDGIGCTLAWLFWELNFDFFV
jgi:hypothetical protein